MTAHSKFGTKRQALTALAVATGMMAFTAQAEDAAATDGTIGEVVVTAQFRQQKLQDTPIAITAVTGEQLEERSATNLSAIADSAPRVILRPAAAAFGTSIPATIRLIA